MGGGAGLIIWEDVLPPNGTESIRVGTVLCRRGGGGGIISPTASEAGLGLRGPAAGGPVLQEVITSAFPLPHPGL